MEDDEPDRLETVDTSAAQTRFEASMPNDERAQGIESVEEEMNVKGTTSTLVENVQACYNCEWRCPVSAMTKDYFDEWICEVCRA